MRLMPGHRESIPVWKTGAEIDTSLRRWFWDGCRRPCTRISKPCHEQTSKCRRLICRTHVGFSWRGAAEHWSRFTRRHHFQGKGAINGAEIKIDGGVLGKVKERGAPEGTQVEVRELFFNTPVRKKFLKSIPTEMAYISEVLTKFSLSYPAIHFTLMHNNRTVFNLPTVQDTAERIATFFGEEMKKHLIPIFLREEMSTLSGYIAPPFLIRVMQGCNLYF